MSTSNDTIQVLQAANEDIPRPPQSSSNQSSSNQSSSTPPTQEQKLVNIEVKDQNIALNLMVSFLSLANKRGSFTLDESAKIWECVKIFQGQNQNQ
jgi:hypothetical protein